MINTRPRKPGLDDLEARGALEDFDKGADCVEDDVNPEDEVDDGFCCACGLEDAEVEEEDGDFGEKDYGTVEDLGYVYPLREGGKSVDAQVWCSDCRLIRRYSIEEVS